LIGAERWYVVDCRDYKQAREEIRKWVIREEKLEHLPRGILADWLVTTLVGWLVIVIAITVVKLL